ncbi:MAG: DUF748 domain-containing protein [Agitococcus sp.]|nr:DUF748 domain-containing protein [Agitococcus sp.]
MTGAPTTSISTKNKKRLLGLGTVFALYSALGFLALPSLAIKFVQEYVENELHLELQIDHIEINPLNLALKIDGIQVKQPLGEVLVSAQHIYINASFLLSLWQQRIWLDELDIQQPYVNVHLDKAGQLNLLQLIPPEKEEPSESMAWQLAMLGVHNANFKVLDESRSQPFSSHINNFNLTLYNMSSLAGNEGNYQFSAQTAKYEKFTWQGKVGLQPIRSQGHFSIENLQLATPANYFAELLPINISQGEFDFSADYQLQIADEASQFNLAQGHIVLRNFQAQNKTSQPFNYRFKQLELAQLRGQWPQTEAMFARVLIQNPEVEDSQTKRKILSMQEASLTEGLWQQSSDVLSLKAFSAHQIALAGQTQSLLQLPLLNINNFRIEKNSLNTGRIALMGGEANLHRLKNGQNNWQQELTPLLTRATQPSTLKQQPVTSSPAMSYHLGEVAINDFVIHAEDQEQQPVFKEQVTLKQVTVNPELDLKKPHQLDADLRLGTGGEMRVVGQLQEAPLSVDAKLTINKLVLPPFAAYLKDVALLKLESGNLDVDGNIHFQQQPKPQATFVGAVGVNDFAANDLKLNERFLAWKRLVASGMTWQLSPMSLRIKEVRADQPFSRIIIAPDKTINLEQIIAKESVSKEGITKNSQAVTVKPALANPTAAIPIQIDKAIVSNGAMLFADLTLTPQFATGIQGLNGDIRGISTAANSHAQVSLQGRVDQYGKATIKGALNPFSPDKNTDMSVKFDNLELTTLTPYSSKFAGYRIDKGKLSLDLNYKVANRQLVAANKIVLNQLTLGERVDSPEAKNLPIRLAIALLKDSNGVIDLDIPITGSLDDPQFRIAPIVWQAIVNVVTKVATAPFRFIAGLVGGGEDMDSMAFTVGQAELSNEVITKLTTIADALNKRPSLRLDLRAVFDEVADAQALKNAKFSHVLNQRMAKGSQELSVLEALYVEAKGSELLKQQRVLQLKPVANKEAKEKLVLDVENYRLALRNQLIDLQDVSAGDLRQLALDRAKAMRTQLIDKLHIDEGRVFVLEPEAGKVNDKQTVVSTVSVNAN